MKTYYNKKTLEIISFPDDTINIENLLGKDFIEFQCSKKEWDEKLQSYAMNVIPIYKDNTIQFISNLSWINSNEGENHALINEKDSLLHYLTNTDYIILKINEAQISDDDNLVTSLKQQYASELNQRKQARVRLNELESELKQLKDSSSEEKK